MEEAQSLDSITEEIVKEKELNQKKAWWWSRNWGW
jgi:hypothetical protein